MAMVNLAAALIMFGGSSWRNTAHAASTCRPSFISLHRQSATGAGRRSSNFLNGIPSQLLSSTDAPPYYDNPHASRRKIFVPAHSFANGRVVSHRSSFLRLSSTFSTSSQNATSSSSSFATDELKPFTWPQLIDLFRDRRENRKKEDDIYISSDHPNLALFRRSLAAQALYEQHKKYLDNNWKSAYDYLVYSKFGEEFGIEKVTVSKDDGIEENEVKPTEDDCNQTNNKDCLTKGYMYRASPSLAQASKYTIENRLTYLRLVLNDFPYDVDEGIEHWCLWKIGGTSCTERISREELTWALKELKHLQADENSGSSRIIDRNDTSNSLDKSRSSLMQQTDPDQQPASILDTFFWVNPPHLQSMPEIHHAHILVKRSDNKSDDEDISQSNEGSPSISPPPV